MFLCHVVPFAVWYSSVLCAEASDVTASVWGTVTDDRSLHMDSESQLWGRVMIAAWVFVMTVSKSWQVFSPIHPPFLFFNPLVAFSLKTLSPLLPFSFPIISYPFLFQVSFFFILHLVFTFIPYSSRSSLPSPSPSPPPVRFLTPYEDCSDWYAWRARGCFSAEHVVNVCLCSSPPTGCAVVALKSAC